MSYYVYVDKPTRQARIHRADCRYCNHGKGLGRGRIEKENWWSRPFPSREDAIANAAKQMCPIHLCKVCKP